jgi:hypothetical protein
MKTLLKDKTLLFSNIIVFLSFVFRHRQAYLEINGEDIPGSLEDLLSEPIIA